MSGVSDVSDVVVVGGGIVGCAIARALAGTSLSVTLVEARDDVGDGTSKANTALLHTGYDASPGTLESRLVARGYELLGDYAERTGIPVERTGAMLVAWTDEERDALPGAEGEGRTKLLPPLRDRRRPTRCIDGFPQLGPGALAGLTVPGESIICTWTTNLALATDAVAPRCRADARCTGDRGRPPVTDTPRCAPRAATYAAAGSSTRRDSGRTTSTPSSGITASPSPRDAANCWCSTS